MTRIVWSGLALVLVFGSAACGDPEPAADSAAEPAVEAPAGEQLAVEAPAGEQPAAQAEGEEKQACGGAICEGYWYDSTRVIGACTVNCSISNAMLNLRDRVGRRAKEVAQVECMRHGCNCPAGGTTRHIPNGTGCANVQDTMDADGNPLDEPIVYCGYWVTMKHYGGRCVAPGGGD